MKKVLPQITFDFDAPAEQEPIPAESIAVSNTAPLPPLVVEIEDTEDMQETTAETEAESPHEPLPVAPKRISSTRGRKSLKETSVTADLIQVPDDEVLFTKQYYSIGEVATMFRENQSLIRYWETEFDILQPRKNKKGDRFFRPVDIKNLVLIYDLLRRRKFTIEGAKDFLKRNKKAEDKFAMIQSLEKIKSFMLELRSNL
jgi:DNA-binding transcriptional MerR regulator